MTKVYTILTLVGSGFFLLSYSANPPDGYTGAPGDSFCVECHEQSADSLFGTISVEGFPSAITPGEIYPLTVVNRNTQGNAQKGGFQMTILGPFNTRAGMMANPSVNAVISISQNRQYFEHNPSVEYPDSNVIKWTVDWTAPQTSPGNKITWYASGNIANGNQESTGDRIVINKGEGVTFVSSSEDLILQQVAFLPNPGSDLIYLPEHETGWRDGKVSFYDLRGIKIMEADLSDDRINVTGLPPGMYWIQMIKGDKTCYDRWIKI